MLKIKPLRQLNHLNINFFHSHIAEKFKYSMNNFVEISKTFGGGGFSKKPWGEEQVSYFTYDLQKRQDLEGGMVCSYIPLFEYSNLIYFYPS